VSTREVQAPIYAIGCDHPGCPALFQASQPDHQRFEGAARWAAGEAGWDVPPPRGKGARRGTDFCPVHSGRTP
jgi:hypothetical protein